VSKGDKLDPMGWETASVLRTREPTTPPSDPAPCRSPAVLDNYHGGAPPTPVLKSRGVAPIAGAAPVPAARLGRVTDPHLGW